MAASGEDARRRVAAVFRSFVDYACDQAAEAGICPNPHQMLRCPPSKRGQCGAFHLARFAEGARGEELVSAAAALQQDGAPARARRSVSALSAWDAHDALRAAVPLAAGTSRQPALEGCLVHSKKNPLGHAHGSVLVRSSCPRHVDFGSWQLGGNTSVNMAPPPPADTSTARRTRAATKPAAVVRGRPLCRRASATRAAPVTPTSLAGCSSAVDESKVGAPSPATCPPGRLPSS